MSKASVIIIIFWAIINLRYAYDFNKAKLISFKLMLVLSVFVNVGYVLRQPTNVSYSNLGMILFILTGLFHLILKKNIINKKQFISLFILIGVITTGLIKLYLSKNMPEVIMMDTIMDDVYYGRASAREAHFSISANITQFFWFILFCISCILSREYFFDKGKVTNIISFIKLAYTIYFAAVLIEVVVNNVIDSTLLRSIVYDFFGKAGTRTYDPKMLFGFYGATSLFSESSYISVVLFYLLLMWVIGIHKKSDFISLFLCAFALVFSGASTGIYLLPLLGLIIIKHVIKEKHINLFKVFKRLLFVFSLFITLVIVYHFFKEQLDTFFMESISKFYSYLNNNVSTLSGSNSGMIRKMGNDYAYHAFLSNPLFGVGIGTTRGYGILPGVLATFGLLGIICYLIFIKNTILLNFKGKWLPLMILVMYSSSLLTVWYLYMPAIFVCFLPFNRNT